MPLIRPFRLLPLVCLLLAGCGATHGSVRAGGYVGEAAAVECAPFARALTGVALSGSAADWWHQADGRYRRGQMPEVGSLLVFRRSPRLPYGHVAVVSRVISQRQILVTQANWVHRRVTVDQPVIDTSGRGDWTAVRVWWPPAAEMGSGDYPTFGFIRPDRPATHDQLAAATPAALNIARNER